MTAAIELPSHSTDRGRADPADSPQQQNHEETAMTNQRYGYYRYGRHEYRPPDTHPPESDVPDDRLTPREAFGAGVALATSDDGSEIPWDFVADSSGDLASTEGYDELGKDLAFSTAREASDLLGMLGSANELARLERRIERIANRDGRLFSSEARVLSGGRGASQRGVGDDLDPDPHTVDVELEADITPDISRRLWFPVARR